MKCGLKCSPLLSSLGLLLAAALPAHAQAARIVGNGGVGVHCQTSTGPTLQILDFYEAEREWAMTTPSLGDPAVDPFVKAGTALDRLAVLDPTRAALYKGWLATFPSEMDLIDETFPVINDYGSPYIGDGCSLVQIAVQHIPQNPEDHRYLISKALWNDPLFNNDQKAGLILHEIIFRDALVRGQTDSIAAHYFTALYASTEMLPGGLKAQDLATRLRDYDLDAYVSLISDPCMAHPDHNKFLYFDRKVAAGTDADAFCSALSEDSGVADLRDVVGTYRNPDDPVPACSPLQFVAWKDSAIGAKLLETPVGEPLWLGTTIYTFTRTDVFEGTYTSPTPPNQTAAFICWENQH